MLALEEMITRNIIYQCKHTRVSHPCAARLPLSDTFNDVIKQGRTYVCEHQAVLFICLFSESAYVHGNGIIALMSR